MTLYNHALLNDVYGYKERQKETETQKERRNSRK